MAPFPEVLFPFVTLVIFCKISPLFVFCPSFASVKSVPPFHLRVSICERAASIVLTCVYVEANEERRLAIAQDLLAAHRTTCNDMREHRSRAQAEAEF